MAIAPSALCPIAIVASFRCRLMRRLINPKRTRKTVEKPAKRDAEREFHNLRLGKMLS
jgi:hypothetical protein